MLKYPIKVIKMALAVLYLAMPTVYLAASPCCGAEQTVAPVRITLDVKNEPLRVVLGKITKKTHWKIKVPNQWLDKPVTQTLNNVKLEDGLRSVLNNAGVENLFLMYDEKTRQVTLFDTETVSKRPADHASSQAGAQPPAVSTTAEPDPRLQRPAAPRMNLRRMRRQSSAEED